MKFAKSGKLLERTTDKTGVIKGNKLATSATSGNHHFSSRGSRASIKGVKLKTERGMTDFGGSGHSGAVAECELNDVPQLASGSATLTTSDLNELGCSISASPLRLESADSGFAPSRTTSTNGDSVIELKTPPPHQPTVKNKPRRRGNPSKHIVRTIIASITSGFSNCSRRKNGQSTPPGGGSNTAPRRHSDSEEDSNSADLFEGNFKNTKTRNISRDGAGFVVGSEATSTGYVSDSVDGYDKYKGLESEHGGSHGDSSLSYGEKKQVEPVCLETSVTQSLSPKLNLNIKYDDEEEEEIIVEKEADQPVVSEEPEEVDETEQVENQEVQMVEKSLVYVEDSDETEEESSEESDSTGDSNTQSGTNSGNGTSIEYTISNRSDSDISEEESTSYYVDRPVRLDVIVEDDEISEEAPLPIEKAPNQVAVVKKKMSVKRKRSSRLRSSGSTTEQDLKNGMKSKLASLRKDLKKEDNRAHSSSLKDMIVQFETAVAALEMSERQVTQHVDDSDEDEDLPSQEPALLGVKAIAQKIQAQTKAVDEGFDCAQMPPSQILKLKQALDLDEEKLSKPVPLSRRSESKVKLIAKQLAEAEKRRIQMEKLAKSQMCKSPKDIKKAASTSFINELLAMAKAEESVDRTNEPSSKVEEPHDFKQSLLAARKKITHREEVAAEKKKTTKTDKKEITKQDLPKAPSVEPSLSEEPKVEFQVPEEAVDPFVREVLSSKTVPEPVKQKIRIECWSLFNDPRTPKGVKQCILATMLSKVQNE